MTNWVPNEKCLSYLLRLPLEQLDAALLAGLQKGDEQEPRHKAEIPEAFEKLASDGLVTARSLLRRFGLFPYGTESPRDRGAGGWV